MKPSCVRVTVFFGADSTLQVEAGNSAAQVNSPGQRYFINPEEPDPIPIVIEVLAKLRAALEDPKGKGIEMATSGRFLVHTPGAAGPAPRAAAAVVAVAAVVPAAAAVKVLAAASRAAAGRVDLNSASEAELTTLPGVGPETARRMIQARPFRSVDELLAVRGIGEVKLAVLRERVKVG
jgi:competence protein ComEA